MVDCERQILKILKYFMGLYVYSLVDIRGLEEFKPSLDPGFMTNEEFRSF